MRHVGTKQMFLLELKEEGILTIRWIRGEQNDADLSQRILMDLCSRNSQRFLLVMTSTSDKIGNV